MTVTLTITLIGICRVATGLLGIASATAGIRCLIDEEHSALGMLLGVLGAELLYVGIRA